MPCRPLIKHQPFIEVSMTNKVLQFAIENGLNPGEIIPDGKVHKFQIDANDKRMAGWYVCFQNHTLSSGEIYHYAIFGNFRYGKDVTHTYSDIAVQMTPEDRVNQKKQLKKARKKVKDEKEQLQKETAVAVEQEWQSFFPNGTCDYLEKKQVQTCPDLGIRYTFEGNAVIPMRDTEEKLWSYQILSFDGIRKFRFGGRVNNTFHVIGSLQDAEKIYISESITTGATIHMATDAPVISCFSASNLVNVAQDIKAT